MSKIENKLVNFQLNLGTIGKTVCVCLRMSAVSFLCFTKGTSRIAAGSAVQTKTAMGQTGQVPGIGLFTGQQPG